MARWKRRRATSRWSPPMLRLLSPRRARLRLPIVLPRRRVRRLSSTVRLRLASRSRWSRRAPTASRLTARAPAWLRLPPRMARWESPPATARLRSTMRPSRQRTQLARNRPQTARLTSLRRTPSRFPARRSSMRRRISVSPRKLARLVRLRSTTRLSSSQVAMSPWRRMALSVSQRTQKSRRVAGRHCPPRQRVLLSRARSRRMVATPR